MAMKVVYTVINGEVVSENRAGVKRDYFPDPLGSTVALLDATQTKTDTWSYWPYGEVKARTGTNVTPFQFVGTLGYYTDSSSKVYVPSRSLTPSQARWLSSTVMSDFVAPDRGYVYADNSPATEFGANMGESEPCSKLLHELPVPKPKEIGECIKECYKEAGEPKKLLMCIAKCGKKYIGGTGGENAKNYLCCIINNRTRDRSGRPMQPCNGSSWPESKACCNYLFCSCVMNRDNGWPNRVTDALCPGKVWVDCGVKAQSKCGRTDDEWSPGDIKPQ